MPSLSKRRLLALSLFAASTARTALAQSWPDRPIRIVVPFPAGAGVLDIMARLLAAHLGPAFGQPIVIDNRPGAGGTIGRRRRREGAGRWLHDADGQSLAGGESIPAGEDALRPDDGFHSPHSGQHRTAVAGRASVGARQLGDRTDRARPLEAGPTELRFGRRRQHAVPRHRTFPVDGQHRRDARPLSRRRNRHWPISSAASSAS